jgi:hypothetical protein
MGGNPLTTHCHAWNHGTVILYSLKKSGNQKLYIGKCSEIRSIKPKKSGNIT